MNKQLKITLREGTATTEQLKSTVSASCDVADAGSTDIDAYIDALADCTAEAAKALSAAGIPIVIRKI